MVSLDISFINALTSFAVIPSGTEDLSLLNLLALLIPHPALLQLDDIDWIATLFEIYYINNIIYIDNYLALFYNNTFIYKNLSISWN